MRQLCGGRRDQAHHQGKRNHKVRRITPHALAQPFLTMSREDDSKWPQKNKDGRQELEIRVGNDHISFEVGNARLSVNGDTDSVDRPPRLARWSM